MAVGNVAMPVESAEDAWERDMENESAERDYQDALREEERRERERKEEAEFFAVYETPEDRLT